MTKPLDPMYKLPTKELTRWAVIKTLRQWVFEPIDQLMLGGIKDQLARGGYKFTTIRADLRYLIFSVSGGKTLRVGYTQKAIVPYADWTNS